MARITKVKRQYSKSIETSNYGLEESWIKITSQMEAEVESHDDVKEVSENLYQMCKEDVINKCNNLIQKMREAATQGVNQKSNNNQQNNNAQGPNQQLQ